MTVKKVKTAKSKKSKIARKPVRKLTLPTELSEPKKNLHEYMLLIYGERKIGKSSLASHASNPLFFMFEAGGNAMRVRQVSIGSWNEFLEYLVLLEKNPSYCDTVVMDTGAVAYDRCMEYVCEREGMTHPSDGEYGKGWRAVADEFKRVHEKIFNLGLGFIITAHSEIKKVQKRSGESYSKLVVDLSGSPYKFYCGIVDVIAYYQYDDDGDRVLTIRGDANIEAGVRMTENFLYPDGSPIIDIPMGLSSEEAYKNLNDAFNNKLTKKESKKVAKVVKKKFKRKK